jgi:lipopolysaccharide/colanic/teichoic acid biosynthesis glycosyltransferase
MISRLRTKKGRLRLPARHDPRITPQGAALLSAERFELAIAKECCRSERRDLTFCMVIFDFEDGSAVSTTDSTVKLAAKFRERLRLIDEIGFYQETLAVLLPETTPAGAAVVANDLTRRGQSMGFQLSTEIFVYPETTIPSAKSDRADVENQCGEDSRSDSHSPGEASNELEALNSDLQKPDVIEPRKGEVQAFKFVRSTPIWKRCLDLCGASLGLVLLMPLFCVIAIAIKLTSRGPVLFTQMREGKDGRIFKIYKFRTMLQGADEQLPAIRNFSEQDGPAFKLKEDPRATPLGRYLRKCCADELPQLINIMKGEMSLVGPRPLPLDESYQCTTWQRRRLDVLPGLTCFWQVEGGREVPFDEWMRMDIAYTRSRNFLTDVKLILKTVVVTILHRGSV